MDRMDVVLSRPSLSRSLLRLCRGATVIWEADETWKDVIHYLFSHLSQECHATPDKGCPPARSIGSGLYVEMVKVGETLHNSRLSRLKRRLIMIIDDIPMRGGCCTKEACPRLVGRKVSRGRWDWFGLARVPCSLSSEDDFDVIIIEPTILS